MWDAESRRAIGPTGWMRTRSQTTACCFNTCSLVALCWFASHIYRFSDQHSVTAACLQYFSYVLTSVLQGLFFTSSFLSENCWGSPSTGSLQSPVAAFDLLLRKMLQAYWPFDLSESIPSLSMDCISLSGTLQHHILLLQPTSWNKPWCWRSSSRVCPCWEHKLEAWRAWALCPTRVLVSVAFQPAIPCHSEESSVGLWTRWTRRQRMRCRIMPNSPALWLLWSCNACRFGS